MIPAAIVAVAVEILKPVVEELAQYLTGERDDPPRVVDDLPEVARSRLALERAKLRAEQ